MITLQADSNTVRHVQGLNIAPALIAVSPTKTVINPVGPLKISDAKVSKTLPALPGPDNTPGPDNNS